MTESIQTRNTMGGKPVYTVPAKTVINFGSGFSHKKLCDGLTFTAGSACQYRCSFCYVEDLMIKNPHWQSVLAKDPTAKFEDVVIRREGAVEAVRKALTDGKGRPKFNQPDDRRVIYASPLVDVAANLELVRETVEICKVILELTNWHIRLLSKSNLLPKIAEALNTHPRFMDSFDSGANVSRQRVIFGVSTGTLDDNLAAAFEQGTAKVSKRIESLHWLQDNGFRTFGMICPSLPQKNYIKFAADMAQALRADKCETVWSEALNARGEAFNRTHAALEAGGFLEEAEMFKKVSTDKAEWENYARATFMAHAHIYHGQFSPDGSPKLKHLQYVNKAEMEWWKNQIPNGAIIL